MPTTVRTNSTLFLTLAALSALSLSAVAQAPDTTGGGSPAYMQSQAAPIERSQPAGQTAQPNDQGYEQPGQQHAPPPSQYRPPMTKTSQPAQGIYLTVSPRGNVTTVAATPDRTEFRVDSGIVNIAVHHPAKDSTILVDLGGGQLDLIKDGFYTFNADTKTARVLVGEAEAFSSANAAADANTKPVKVKENHAIAFNTAQLRSVEFEPFQARTDVLPRDSAYNHGDGYPPYPAYGYGFYGYGYPYYPYYAWGYPYYGWGYPYGFGLGFGYYGGFGGFYGRGFYGRR